MCIDVFVILTKICACASLRLLCVCACACVRVCVCFHVLAGVNINDPCFVMLILMTSSSKVTHYMCKCMCMSDPRRGKHARLCMHACELVHIHK